VGFVLFGLTGGFASGKSTVAARWRERGLPVIDADQMAREVVLPGTPGLAEVVAIFGPDILHEDGTLDRKQVAARVFADPAMLGKLEAATHPRIAAATRARAGELERQGEPLACYEAALLVERGIAEAFRPLVVVAAPESAQIARAIARDRLSEDDVRARLAAQLPMDRKTAVADYVIRNDGDRAALLRQADELLDEICRRLDVDPARYRRTATL
jgi:dephospho-CoA kinase